MNLDFHKLLLKHLKAVYFSVFVVKFYQKMIHHTFRYTTLGLNHIIQVLMGPEYQSQIQICLTLIILFVWMMALQ